MVEELAVYSQHIDGAVAGSDVELTRTLALTLISKFEKSAVATCVAFGVLLPAGETSERLGSAGYPDRVAPSVAMNSTSSVLRYLPSGKDASDTSTTSL